MSNMSVVLCVTLTAACLVVTAGAAAIPTYNRGVNTANDTECISSIQIVAVTGNEDEAGFDSGNGNIVEFVTVNDQVYQVTMTGSVSRGSTYQTELEVVATGCLRVMEITEVHLLAFNDDGWLIASIDIGTRVGNEDYQLLTSDSDLNLWLDGNSKYEYPHDATDIKLTLANKCIVSIIIIALTGTRDNAGHLSSNGNHQLKVVLLNGTIIEDIPGDMYRRQQYKQEIPIVTTMCLGIRDISEVQLVGESGDGWFIAAFNTYIKKITGNYRLLTSDPHLDQWLDSGDNIRLSLVR